MAGIPNQVSHVGAGGGLEGNTSSAIIADGGSFTGAWVRVDVGSRLVLAIAADQDLDILIQYSVDGGTNTDSSIPRYYRTDQIEAPHIFVNARPYVRIVVTNNSGSATTYTRINPFIVKESGQLNIPFDAIMSQDYDSIAVRASSYFVDVARGKIQGHEIVNKFGYNLDIDSAAPEVIASFGGTFQRMTAADTLDFVSTSANDASGGTGANSIVISGVDENRDLQIEVIALNGTTPVTTVNQWLGVNSLSVFLFGSAGSNVGEITATATTAGSTQAQMPIGGGVTQQLIYHVPRMYTIVGHRIRFSVNKLSGGASPRVTIRAWVYSPVNQGVQEVYQETIDTAVSNILDVQSEVPFPVVGPAILYATASTDTNNTIVSARYNAILTRDANA